MISIYFDMATEAVYARWGIRTERVKIIDANIVAQSSQGCNTLVSIFKLFFFFLKCSANCDSPLLCTARLCHYRIAQLFLFSKVLQE